MKSNRGWFVVLVVSWLVLAGCGANNGSSPFKEGTHYLVLSTPGRPAVAADEVEVLEVFWYGCPHCYALDRTLRQWSTERKPSYAQLVRVPGTGLEIARTHAQLFFAVDDLGQLQSLHAAIFDEIQSGHPLVDTEQMSAFLGAHGVDTAAFRTAFASAEVARKVEEADALNRLYRIYEVPSIVVNGKYKTDLVMAGGEQQLLALLDELIRREHDARLQAASSQATDIGKRPPLPAPSGRM